jgi:hypothetical protein
MQCYMTNLQQISDLQLSAGGTSFVHGSVRKHNAQGEIPLSNIRRLVDTRKRKSELHQARVLSAQLLGSCGDLCWVRLTVCPKAGKTNEYRRRRLNLHLRPIKIRSNNNNSVALFRQRTLPIERQPLHGEVSAKFCGLRVPRGLRDGFPRSYF